MKKTASHNSIRIFLADSQKMMREGLRTMLERVEGFRIVGDACRGEPAWSQIRQQCPDVALIDVKLPDLAGLEVAARVLANHPSVRVIMLSAHVDQHLLECALQAGVHGFLLKTCAFSDLENAIRKVYAGERYFCSTSSGLMVQQYIKRLRTEVGTEASSLNVRDVRILRMLSQGLSARQIAEEIGISPKTVDANRRDILKKLELQTTADLIKFALRTGLADVNQ